MSVIRTYGCECPRDCRQKLRLTDLEYRELSTHGAVVSPYCTQGRRVVHREAGVRVVATAKWVLR